MSIIILYLATAAVFLIADAVMLRAVVKPLFESYVGPLMLESPRLVPAVVFYLFYVAGLVWLVSLPALRNGVPGQALVNGAILGALAYGTFEFTSYAILRDWNVRMVLTDTIWGTVLTGMSAWLGVLAVRALT